MGLAMLSIGIFIIVVASIIRSWGNLNHNRSEFDRPLIFHNPSFTLLIGLGSTLLGIIGSICIGIETNFLVGLLAFVAFWMFSGIWTPIIIRLGL